MARPSPEVKAQREARRAKVAAIRDEELAAQERGRVQVDGIVAGAVATVQARKPGELPGLIDILDELEQARQLALAASVPAAAVNASMAKAKLLGMIVERAQVVQGTPAEYAEADAEQIYERVKDKWGPRGLEVFKQAADEMRRLSSPTVVIDHDDEAD